MTRYERLYVVAAAAREILRKTYLQRQPTAENVRRWEVLRQALIDLDATPRESPCSCNRPHVHITE